MNQPLDPSAEIERLRKVNDELRREIDKRGSIINAMPTTVWSTLPDGYCDFLNARWLDYAGMSAEQANGWGWTEAIHPDDKTPLAEYWQGCLASGTPVYVEARMRRFDGTYRWFLFLANPLHDEAGTIIRWYGTNVDIDDRKRAEEELRRSEALLAETQHLTRIGSFSWRVAKNEIRWTDELYRIFELDPGLEVSFELIGSRVHPDDLPMMIEMMGKGALGVPTIEYEHRLLLPDRSIRYLHFIAHAIHRHDGEVEYVGAVQDVTERELAEEAIAKGRAELAHVARVMSLGMLTAAIAHEVNQPLSGIVTNAGTCLRMLNADPPNIDGSRETAHRMIRDGNRAAEVISRLRTLFARKEIAAEPVDVNEVSRDVIALSLNEWHRDRVIPRLELADGALYVKGDRVQLQQVILNLLRNAVDAMISIADRPKELLVKTERDGEDRIKLTVKDVGVGFDLQLADKLFEGFYTTKSDGMGIGLSVSRSIIEAHQGRLWATLNEGPGASFAFSIPGI
jgi:PAS domain S-box-containing protein